MMHGQKNIKLSCEG